MLFMNGEIMKNILIRVLMLCVGGILIGIAIAMCAKTGWGADPLTVFYDGLSKTMNITQGLASNYTSYAMILLVIFINYKQLGIGTLVVPFCTQFGIDYGLQLIPVMGGLTAILMLAAGFILLALGVSITIEARMGKSAYDALIFSLSEKFHMQYHHIRWILDILLVVFGVTMKGNLTFATLVAVLIMGKMITFFNSIIEKAMNPILKDKVLEK